MYYSRPLRPDELMHHGRKGQHWGAKNGPPYPLSRLKGGVKSIPQYAKKAAGKLASAGRNATSTVKKTAGKIHDLKVERSQKKEDKKDPGMNNKDATREQVLKSTDPKFVYEHRHQLTDKEINERINRIDLENRLLSRVPEPKPGVTDKVKKILLEKGEKAARDLSDLAIEQAKNYAKKQIEKKLNEKDNAKKKEIEDIIRSGDKEQIAKNAKKLTADQLREANNRITELDKLSTKKTDNSYDAQSMLDKLKSEKLTAKDVQALRAGKQFHDELMKELNGGDGKTDTNNSKSDTPKESKQPKEPPAYKTFKTKEEHDQYMADHDAAKKAERKEKKLKKAEDYVNEVNRQNVNEINLSLTDPKYEKYLRKLGRTPGTNIKLKL